MSPPAWRRAAGAVLLVLMAASAVYGGDFFGVRDRLAPPASRTRDSAFGPAEPRRGVPARAREQRRSQPYWVTVRRFAGSGGTTTPAFSVDRRALQWRVAWRCERGPFAIRPQRLSGEAYRPLADTADCPARDEGRSVASGDFRLQVDAQAGWEARVEQQVDVPLAEPPTATMTAPGTREIARARFYGIDEDGSGSARVYREPDGGLSLRLEDFYVTPNVDLEIRLSELARPKSTRAVAAARHRDIVFLKATTGSMNYRLPAGALDEDVKSIVIWCENTRNAYAAATLAS